MTFSLACFDLDGCLVDSRAPISAGLNEGLRAVGLPARPPEELHHLIGPPLLGSFERLLEEQGVDPARAVESVAAYRRVYPALAEEHTTVVDGIPALLDALSDRLHLVVVTSKPRVTAVPILDHLGLRRHFREVYGPELDALEEPKAAKLARAIAEADVPDRDPTRVVMIGDRRHDVEAGRACGTATIGVTWGIGDRDELEAAGADRVVDHPEELLDLG